MKLRNLFFTALFTLIAVQLTAQKGTIRGTVYEGDTGEPMYGVTVLIEGTSNGAISDFDGKFEISVEPGSYTVKATFVSFQSIVINDVNVTPGKVVLLDNLIMQEASSELGEVVVTAEMVRNTDAALLNARKKSINLFDGISAASFKKIGDGDAAAASQRVPGVSVQDGKYIFVRGLGDRYTKSILNGMTIPGLDPDRNTVQMDLFPTNVLDNIIIVKTFTPDLAADFTGGIVDLQTKDFPDEKIFSISGGLGYNPSMHFNSEYLDYEGGGTDFLGFDDGSREIPTGDRNDLPFLAEALGNPDKAADYTAILSSFNTNLAAMRQRSGMDMDFGLARADQFKIGNLTFGYNASLNYKNTTQYYEGAQFKRWAKDNQLNVFEMNLREDQSGDFGTNNVLLGGLLGLALKGENAKYRFNLLKLQNGESKAGIFDYFGSDQGAVFEGFQHNLEYNQRELTNILLSGDHFFNESGWELNWRVSPTRSSIEDPDIRFTRMRTDSGGDEFTIGTESGLPERIWRNLEEDNLSSKVDMTKKLSFNGRESKIKFGGAYDYKDRAFSIRNFQFRTNSTVLTGNPDDILQPENIWTPENRNGVTFDALFIPRNTNLYDANVNAYAGYVSTDLTLTDRLKSTFGVRFENYVQNYTGEDQTGIFVLQNEEVLNDADFFPAMNFIYAVEENTNLRMSYARTIARPSLKEASFANILDPLTGRTFIGGFFPDVDVVTGEQVWDGNLQSTRIDNFDLRFEKFLSGAQSISVSAFYKTFDNPIEMVQYIQIVNNFQPRNVGDGEVLGFEFELRKNLDFLGTVFNNFTFVGNTTIVDSKILRSNTELKSIQDNARPGETIEEEREMAGQAPYIINAGLTYQKPDNSLSLSVFYNVQGKTLEFVGIADRPNIYTMPFNNLMLNINKSFGAEQQYAFSLKVDNLLDDERESRFESFGAESQIFTLLRPRRTVSLGFTYNIF